MLGVARLSLHRRASQSIATLEWASDAWARSFLYERTKKKPGPRAGLLLRITERGVRDWEGWPRRTP
jgi:hypothetical protein